MKKGNFIAAALFAALAVYVIWVTASYPSSKGGVPGPAVFPTIIASMMLMAAVSLIITTIRMRPDEDRPLNLGDQNGKRVYLTMGILVVYTLLVPVVGFVSTSAVLMFALVKWFGKYSFIVCALWGIGIPFALYIVFSEVLHVPFRFGFLL